MSKQPANQDLVGMHVKASRTGYSHHGIYVRHGHVIQYGGGISGGQIEEVTVSQFTKGAELQVVQHDKDRRYTPRETVERARRKVNEDDYNVAMNNCEQFANWCVTGEAKSSQVENVKRGLASVAAAIGGLKIMSG
jgi:hypothetical protein